MGPHNWSNGFIIEECKPSRLLPVVVASRPIPVRITNRSSKKSNVALPGTQINALSGHFPFCKRPCMLKDS